MWAFRSSLAAITFVALAALPNAAAAQGVDARQLVKLVLDQAAANGLNLTINGAEPSGSDVVLRGVTLDAASGDPIELDRVRLENVRALSGGGFVIGRIGMGGSEFVLPGGKLQVGAWGLTEVLVPKLADTSAWAFYSEGFEMQPSRVVGADGVPLVEIGRIAWTSSPYAAGRVLTTRLLPAEVTLDLAALANARGTALPEQLGALGIAKLTARLTVEGSWRDNDGRTGIAIALEAVGLGKLGLQLDLSGLTAARLRDMNKLAQSQQEKRGGPQSLAQQDQAALFAHGQAVQLVGFALRYDDASLAGRLLDDAARRAGRSRSEYVSSLEPMLPLLVAFLRDPKLAADASAALKTFFTAPRSLDVRLAPAQPLSLLEVALTAIAAPETVARRLKVEVKANSAER